MTATSRTITIQAIGGIPRIEDGDDLVAILCNALAATALQDGDVLTVTSKLFSRAQGRFQRVSTIVPSSEAIALAQKVEKDPQLVQLILDESVGISRAKAGVLIVRHKLGMVCANAGIDRSNAMPRNAPVESVGDWALLLPPDPDKDAQQVHDALYQAYGVRVGIIVTDSHGRPFRNGSVGIAIGAAGVTIMDPHEQRVDLDGRPLEVTCTANADQIAAAADMAAGQADEGTPVVLIRGLRGHGTSADTARELVRDPQFDLYA